MFTFIEGLPSDVLAIEARGEVTHDDYRNTLIPKAEAMKMCIRDRDMSVIVAPTRNRTPSDFSHTCNGLMMESNSLYSVCKIPLRCVRPPIVIRKRAT